jgi:peptide chain release factor 1
MQVLDSKPTDLGGIKSATAMISGHGAFGELRWESGVHRATMVPGNDKHGRMQTGTAVVIALPEAPDNVSQSAIPLWVSVIVVREGG